VVRLRGLAPRRGIYVAGDALQDTEHATTVRVQEGKTLTTDDRSPRRRSSWAATTCSSARTSTRRSGGREVPGRAVGSIEVRPIQTFDDPRARSSLNTSRARSPPACSGVSGGGGRDPHPGARRLRPGRGGRPGGVRPRARDVPATACPTTPGPGSRRPRDAARSTACVGTRTSGARPRPWRRSPASMRWAGARTT